MALGAPANIYLSANEKVDGLRSSSRAL
ncbi:hypothetical protein [Photobacterium leiognathi]